MASLVNRIDTLIDRILSSSPNDAKKTAESDSSLSTTKAPQPKQCKHFHMKLNNLVFDAIDGELYTNPSIRRLYVPNDDSIKVVYRSDWLKTDPSTNAPNKKIAVLTGGGSGHEPCFFGYVGYGMLTAAVCGEIFASPTTKSILYTILRISIDNNKSGVLLLVGNYTGDVLNFSLAMKIASTQYGIPCKAIFLADDIAIPESNISNTGARGIAGQALVHKIAGYYCQHGYSLDEMHNICDRVNKNIGTVGISASICHHFGREYSENDEMKNDMFELGLGVHGEPGFKEIKVDNVYKVVEQVINVFAGNKGKFLGEKEKEKEKEKRKKERVVVLLNNLGSVTNMEMLIIKKYLLDYLYYNFDDRIIIERFYSGKFETSLDMKGFSVTIMKDIDDELLKALDFEVPVKVWKNNGEKLQGDALRHAYFKPVNKTQKSEKSGKEKEKEKEDEKGQNQFEDKNTREILDLIASNNEQKLDSNANKNLVLLSDSQSEILKKCIISCCNTLISNKNLLNNLDKMVGDGDCGSTLEFGCKLLLDSLNNENNELLKCKSLVLTFSQISQLLSDMGASSGALYGYLFICASNQCATKMSNKNTSDGDVNVAQLGEALRAAVYDLSDYSRAKLNDRTMMDALIPAVEALVKAINININDKDNNCNAMDECAKAAEEGCNRTQNMKAKFGRSSYIASDLQKKCVDPGARAVALWVNSIAKVIANS